MGALYSGMTLGKDTLSLAPLVIKLLKQLYLQNLLTFQIFKCV